VKRIIGTILAAAAATAAPLAAQRADLVVYGRIWTGDSARPWAEAVAVRGAEIAVVGLRGEVRGLVGPGTRVLDNGANLSFALAAEAGGLLTLTSVLGSLYPVATVVLARFVLHERLAPLQTAGVVAAMIGVALIAAG